MAIAIDSTLAGETANSYVAVSYCDDYWAQHYSSIKAEQWSELSAAAKALTLVVACRHLETLRFTSSQRKHDDGYAYEYNQRTGLVVGVRSGTHVSKYLATQALQFPRNVDYNSAGTYYVPDAIKFAQCEQAVYLLSFDESAMVTHLQGVDYEEVTAGAVTVRQRLSGAGGSIMSPVAIELVRPYLLRSGVVGRG